MADDWDDEEEFSGESGVPSPTEYDDEFDDDWDDDDPDSSKGGLLEKLKEKRKLISLVLAGVIGVSALGGGAFYFFSGDDEGMQTADAPTGNSVGGAVSLALTQQATSGLTPQQKAPNSPATQAPLLTQGAGSEDTAAPATAAPTGELGGYDPNDSTAPLSRVTAKGVGIAIPATLAQAFDHLGPAKASDPLPTPNDQALFEESTQGFLPRISPEGKESWQTYARPFQLDQTKPHVGIVVTGLGLSKTLSEAALKHLPANVTLAFSPYAPNLKTWLTQARAMGHEVLIELPMESESFPVDDPGPLAMLTSQSPRENLKTLKSIMAQGQGYIGFIAQHGSRFTKNNKAMTPILAELKSRGLFFMDPRTATSSVSLRMADKMQLPRAIADVTINSMNAPATIRAQLDALTLSANSTRITAAAIPVTPSAITALKQWGADLGDGPVKLAPISSIAGRQAS